MISNNYFVPPGGSVANLIVGADERLGGKLILTVSRLRLFAPSSSELAPITAPRGGRGGCLEPELAGFGSGCWSSQSSFSINDQDDPTGHSATSLRPHRELFQPLYSRFNLLSTTAYGQPSGHCGQKCVHLDLTLA